MSINLVFLGGSNPLLGALGLQAITSQALASWFGSALQRAVGEALKDFVDYAANALGMSPSEANELRGIIDRAISDAIDGGDASISDLLQGRFGHQIDDFGRQVLEMLKEQFKKDTAETKDEKGNNVSANVGRSSGGAGMSWYAKLAMALGQAMNEQADKVEALADEVVDTIGAKSSGDQQKNFDKMMQLQAETRVLQTLIETGKNAITTIGDALAAAGRKN